jgi:acyl CoA:acetate/3-ketoacid CoA transferase beta subunit
VTDLAVLKRRHGTFVVDDVAPGFSVEEAIALTGMDIPIPPGT